MKRKVWRKVTACALTGAMAFSLAACGSSSESDSGASQGSTSAESSEAGTEDSTASSGKSISPGEVSPMKMSVDGSTGEMTIERPQLAGTAMGADGTWTIFIHLCGTDLESGNGAAVTDLGEMAQATESEKVKFVVQTGGTSTWNSESISNEKIQRFVVENGDITPVYEGDNDSMGDPSTLESFLTWGVQTYPADNMGVILWDHGNGSIYGVCFDELHENDGLTLRELDSALLSTQQYMTEKFEFIGFDACLMGNVEAANILANYANYMYGSEELEPGCGWNYVEIGNYLAQNPGASGADLGPIVCDSFYKGCQEIGDSDVCTLACIDLSKMDDVVKSFNTFAKDMYEAGNNTDNLSTMLRNIEAGEKFGANNKNEGYSNMLDLGGIVKSCSDFSQNADAVLQAIDAAVVYKIAGPNHPDACGLSTYYPLAIQGSEELKTFSDITISPNYMSFIDRQGYNASYYSNEQNNEKAEEQSNFYHDEENGIYYFQKDDQQYCYEESSQKYYIYNEETEEFEETDGSDIDISSFQFVSQGDNETDYSNEGVTDSDGNWEWNCDYEQDSTTKSYRSKPKQTDHFNYADSYQQSGESKHIKFLEKAKLDKDGVFGFKLTKYSLDHTEDVCANVYQVLNDNEALLLGDTYDVECDWDKGVFKDCFDGSWISLPDGQNICTFIVDKKDDFIIYTSPIKLNGQETNLRIKQMLESGELIVEGAWDGLAESGAASREIKKIKEGDKIVPMYYSYTLDDKMTESEYEGEEYTVQGDFSVNYSVMDTGDFMYAFVIDDIYSDYYMTDLTVFHVDDKGEVSFVIEED